MHMVVEGITDHELLHSSRKKVALTMRVPIALGVKDWRNRVRQHFMMEQTLEARSQGARAADAVPDLQLAAKRVACSAAVARRLNDLVDQVPWRVKRSIHASHSTYVYNVFQ
eukprot:350761-Amphidinium_carterae.1